VIVIKLKEAMLAYGRRTGARLTYEDVSELTGIPTETLRSIGGRPAYHCSVARIEVLCRALGVPLHDMLEMIDDPPKAKRAGRRRASGK
jgi:DNA-binding Xre family transcriptional regulator